MFALGIALAGRPLVELMTSNAVVRDHAMALIPFAALQPLIGAPAWLLDGMFIGATRGRALRNAGDPVDRALYRHRPVAAAVGRDRRVARADAQLSLPRGHALSLWLPGLVRDVGPPPPLAEPAPGT